MGRRPSPIDGDRWERRFEKVLEALPYALLAGSAVLSLIQPGQTSGERLANAGLVALAAAWVLSMYTLRPPRSRERTGPTTPTSRSSARPPTGRKRSRGSSEEAPTWC